MKKTIVYILATDFAGSHYLSLMLGSHSRVRHLGEVKRLGTRRGSRRIQWVCSACQTKGACPILGGIGPHNVDSLYDIIFSRVDPQVEVLVDNSKLIQGWVTRFMDQGKYDLKFIHLIRDPRALVRRWLLEAPGIKRGLRQVRRFARITSAHPELAGPILRGGKTVLLTYNWLEQNQRITNFLAQHQFDTHRLTYYDLCHDTPGELTRVMKWLGLDYEPGQPEYWNFEHHGSQKPSYDWNLEKKTTFFDVRWQTFLTPAVIQQISHDPFVQQYLQEIGIQFREDGLTRPPVKS